MQESVRPGCGVTDRFPPVDCDGHCLRIRFVTQFRLENARKVIERLGPLCQKHAVSQVLLDVRGISGEVTVVDRYELGELFGSALPHGLRVAILATESMVLPDRFIQTVANNRGGNILVTTDPGEAAGWLGTPVEYVDPPS